ncbi:oxidoreductase [Cytobacillus sp. IB215316]|uniref:oxidoreductase n=1 Tax=Cytobacillus sp. IB215316 TaxID=3097354 RepID=UPI002A0FBF96|nr:oxidoreductase [Cytobacillus sp. IB215316]MDX8363494.1 oxidoreductase [Cytobacillus sp. IB215316]
MMKKIALVTGASSGIGEDTALRLMEAGFVVYGAARRLDRMESLKKEGVKTLPLDVTDDESMVKCVKTIIKEAGRIDVLVNNAGYGSYGALEDVPMSEAKRQFEVCVFGLGRMTQLVLPHMRKQKSGKIVNISSVGGKIGEPHGSWYHAAKFAVEGMSDSIRMELKQFGIDVIVIEPGSIKTEWNGIARENMLKVSGKSVYGDLVKKHANMLKNFEGRGSDPSIIGNTIVKAVTASKPKTRYCIGTGGPLMLNMRRLLSDRMFDRMMLSQMK